MNNEIPKGFNGLSYLVSTIEIGLTPITEPSQTDHPIEPSGSWQEPSPPEHATSSEESNARTDSGPKVTVAALDNQAEQNKSGMSRGCLLLLLVISLVVGLVMLTGHGKNSGSKYSPSLTKVSKQGSTKKLNAQHTREAQKLLTDLGYKPGPIDGDYGRRTTTAVKAFQREIGVKQDGWIDLDLLSALRRATAKLKTPAIKPTSLYVKPSVSSNNVLSVSQIRWCIRESMRIRAMRNVFDTNGGIEKFNSIVNDYNGRCVNYRYRKGTLSKAERDVEIYRTKIVSEAAREAKLINQRY